MASNTSRLDLLKKDPVVDGNDTFNIKTMLNDNWDKIDKMTALIDPVTGKLLPGQENPVDVSVIEQQLTDIEDSIGNLPTLETVEKSNLVAAINEVKRAVAAHLAESVHLGEVHGFRLTDGKLEYFDGAEWVRVKGDGYPVGNISEFSAKAGNGEVTLTWGDPPDVTVEDSNGSVIKIAKWAGTKIIRKTNAYPVDESDGVLVVDNRVREKYETGGFLDAGLTNDIAYYYMAFPYTEEDVVTVDAANRVSVTPSEHDDLSGSPGPKDLIAGDMQAGYFGTVPASALFTGSELSSAVGISAGTLQHNTTDWLKFAWKGKILFRPTRPIRHTISWDNINAAGCVFGAKVVKKNGLDYKVRLMKGALTDPSKYTDSDRGAKGSEWNRLMLPIHEKAADKSWAYPAYVETDIPDWGIGFTDADLLTHSTHGNGSYQWCQETRNDNTASRVIRGNAGVSRSDAGTASSANANYGWAPVLELSSL